MRPPYKQSCDGKATLELGRVCRLVKTVCELLVTMADNFVVFIGKRL